MNSVAVSNANGVIQEDVRIIAQGLSDELTPLAGSTILITGGSGFLCSYLLDTLAYLNDNIFAQQCRLVSIDNLRSGLSERVSHLTGRPDFRFISHDVSQALNLDEPVHWIVH